MKQAYQFIESKNYIFWKKCEQITHNDTYMIDQANVFNSKKSS